MTAAVGLLAVVAVLAGGIGWVAGEQSTRRREADARAQAAVESAKEGLRLGEPYDTALIAAVQRATAQRDSGDISPEMLGRIDQLLRDVQMLERMDRACLQGYAVMQRQASGKKQFFDYAGANQLYTEAFAGYGLDPLAASPAETADALLDSLIRLHLITALDDWAYVRNNLLGQKAGGLLGAAANLADDDPWRKRLRAAMWGNNQAALVRMAEEKEAWNQPAITVAHLGRSLRGTGDHSTSERLLRQTQQRRPGDFLINFDLGASLMGGQRPNPAEAVRFCQAALSVRPKSSVVYFNLGHAFRELEKAADAEYAFSKAIEFQPDFAAAHAGLACALADQGKVAEADAAYRKALEFNVQFPVLHYNYGLALLRQGKHAEAEPPFRKAVEQNPGYAEAHEQLA